MKNLLAHWELARGGNALVTALAVWVGGQVGAMTFDARMALLGGLAAACTAAFGNIVNDLYDRAADVHLKSHRPLPSGRITTTSAWLDAALFATAAAVCSHLVNHLSFLIVCITLVALWLYSWKLKGWHGVGHLVVSLLSGLSFLFGATVQGETFGSLLVQGWIAFAFAAVWHLAREWAKAAEDVDEDRAAGWVTLAVWQGEKVACRAASATLMFLLLTLWWPYTAGYFGLGYLLLVVAAVAPVLAGAAYTLWFVPDRARLGQVVRLLKWDMLAGVAAIWFG